jgi:hypothetical protein
MLVKDPVTNPFNEWLVKYGMYVAIGVASVILIIVAILFIMSKTKKH